jgi:hypothetical protein
MKTKANIQAQIADRLGRSQLLPGLGPDGRELLAEYILDGMSLEDHLIIAEEMTSRLASAPDSSKAWRDVHEHVSDAVDRMLINIARAL